GGGGSHRLAALRGGDGGFGNEWDDQVERTADAALELGPADLAAMARAYLVGDHERLRPAFQRLRQLNETMGVAQRRERQVGDDNGGVGGGDDLARHSVEAAWQIDDQTVVILGERREQRRHGG